jgi:DNA-binding MarR family transcriptional regulator
VAGEDKRTRAVALTQEGRAALERAFPYWQEAQKQIVTILGDDAWTATRAGLLSLEGLYQQD